MLKDDIHSALFILFVTRVGLLLLAMATRLSLGTSLLWFLSLKASVSSFFNGHRTAPCRTFLHLRHNLSPTGLCGPLLAAWIVFLQWEQAFSFPCSKSCPHWPCWKGSARAEVDWSFFIDKARLESWSASVSYLSSRFFTCASGRAGGFAFLKPCFYSPSPAFFRSFRLLDQNSRVLLP